MAEREAAAAALKETQERIAELEKELGAAKEMLSKPREPSLVIKGSHCVEPAFDVDWTQVKHSSKDLKKYKEEIKRRDFRNRWIQEYLVDSRVATYTSTGDSMWPLVQSGDGCMFYPIQAVTKKAGRFSIQKEASEIEVGDIVFCQVQTSQLYYAHIVHKVERIYVPGCRSYAHRS